MMYVLLNIKRRKLGVRHLVSALEDCIVNSMKPYGIEAYPKANAPGVYVNEDKLCSIGLRIRKGCSFHGLALNVNMDLSPFQRINPCGYAGLQMIQSKQLNGPQDLIEAGHIIVDQFCDLLSIKRKFYQEGF
jgi:lipoyl(octanoyl) transferase